MLHFKDIIGKLFECTLFAIILFFISFRSCQCTAVNKIQICYGTDNGYIYQTVVSITSLCENANPGTFYDIRIMLSPDVTDENKVKLLSLTSKFSNCTIDFVDMGHEFENCKASRWPKVIYYKLLMQSKFPNFNKCIWLDSDTIIMRDLDELWETDVENYYIASAWDCNGNSDPEINAGVILWNLEKCRAENVEEKMMNLYEFGITNKNYKFPEEDIITNACGNKILFLKYRFNVLTHVLMYPKMGKKCGYSQEDIDEGRKNPAVIHYTGGPKPWQDISRNSSVRDFQQIWWKTAKKTPYFDEIVEKYVKPMQKSKKAKFSRMLDEI